MSRVSTKKDNLCYLEIFVTIKEVTEILYHWTLEDIRKFRIWLRENQNSGSLPWKED